MKLTCHNGTPELYPDNCDTGCPEPEECSLHSMAKGGVVFSWLPGGKSCDCSACVDPDPVCGKDKSGEQQ
jgi:hypothetical protein